MTGARREEFRDFVTACYPSLLRTGYLLTGDRGHAEDAVQSALIRAYLGWPRLREPTNAEAFARTVLVRAVLRGRRRRWHGERPVALPLEHGGIDVTAQVDLADAVRRALATLPAAQRTVLVLRYYDERSEAEIAELLGCALGTVKGRAARGLATLRAAGLLDDDHHPTGAAMTEHDRVRTLLAAAAELAEPAGDPGAELARRGERRRLRRRAAGLTALAALTAAAIAVPLTLTGGTENGAPSRLTISPSATSPAGPTAAEIAADTWNTPPPGPVPAYAGASVLWTGTHLLVWGGSSGPRLQIFHADGASYDPVTRSWQKMAAAPISGRDGQAAVWTGREMIVWGGTGGPTRQDATGAAYDPATDTWRTLPASPLPAETRAHAVWTGQQVIVLGGSADPTAVASYDPAANRWRSLPPVPGQRGRQVAAVVPVWTGSELLAFAEPGSTAESRELIVS